MNYSVCRICCFFFGYPVVHIYLLYSPLHCWEPIKMLYCHPAWQYIGQLVCMLDGWSLCWMAAMYVGWWSLCWIAAVYVGCWSLCWMAGVYVGQLQCKLYMSWEYKQWWMVFPLANITSPHPTIFYVGLFTVHYCYDIVIRKYDSYFNQLSVYTQCFTGTHNISFQPNTENAASSHFELHLEISFRSRVGHVTCHFEAR